MYGQQRNWSVIGTNWNLLKEKWSKEDVRIEAATFVFPGTEAPLSRELTEQQKGEIQHQWDATLTGEASKGDLQAIRSFCGAQFSGPPAVTTARVTKR